MSRRSFLCFLIYISTINFLNCSTIPKLTRWNLIPCYKTSTDGSADSVTSCNSCVTVYNEYSIIKRGCYEDESSLCDSNVKCAQCAEPNCNRGHPNHWCIQCDSKQDRSCLDKSEMLKPTKCWSELTEDHFCYVQWDKTTGDNKRGCVTEKTEYQNCLRNRDTCEMCQSNQTAACNSFEFPENRRKCVQCYSGFHDCPSQIKTDTISKYSGYCKSNTDRCVVLNRGSGQQWQLCESDLSTSEKKYCSENQNRCTYCNDGNNCNWNDKMDETTENPGDTTSNPGDTTSNPGNTTPNPGDTTSNPGNTTPDISTELPTTTTKKPNHASSLSICKSIVLVLPIIVKLFI